MAEGGDISYSSGSECIYDFYCELCVEEGNHLEANGYCTNCKEYVCEECYHGHRKTRSSRHHVLVDKSNMPRDTPLPSNRVSKIISTMCKSHNEDLVKFYCKFHHVFGCSTCFATEHRSCPDVESILEKSENILESQEYESFITKLQLMMLKSDELLKLSLDNTTLIRKRCSDAVRAVRQVKEEAVSILETTEEHLVKLAERLCSEGGEQMENLNKECSALSERLEAVHSNVASLRSSKRVCELYIKIKETQPDVISMQSSLRIAESKNAMKMFTFEPNPELKRYLKTPRSLGKISYQDEDAREISPCSSIKPSKTTATNVGDINIGSSGGYRGGGNRMGEICGFDGGNILDESGESPGGKRSDDKGGYGGDKGLIEKGGYFGGKRLGEKGGHGRKNRSGGKGRKNRLFFE